MAEIPWEFDSLFDVDSRASDARGDPALHSTILEPTISLSWNVDQQQAAISKCSDSGKTTHNEYRDEIDDKDIEFELRKVELELRKAELQQIHHNLRKGKKVVLTSSLDSVR